MVWDLIFLVKVQMNKFLGNNSRNTTFILVDNSNVGNPSKVSEGQHKNKCNMLPALHATNTRFCYYAEEVVLLFLIKHDF